MKHEALSESAGVGRKSSQDLIERICMASCGDGGGRSPRILRSAMEGNTGGAGLLRTREGLSIPENIGGQGRSQGLWPVDQVAVTGGLTLHPWLTLSKVQSLGS